MLFSHFAFFYILFSLHFYDTPLFSIFLSSCISRFVSPILSHFLLFSLFIFSSVLFFCFPSLIFLSSSLHFLCPVSVCAVKNVLSLSKLEVPTAATLKITIFGDVTPCSLIQVYRRFRRNLLTPSLESNTLLPRRRKQYISLILRWISIKQPGDSWRAPSTVSSIDVCRCFGGNLLPPSLGSNILPWRLSYRYVCESLQNYMAILLAAYFFACSTYSSNLKVITIYSS
jgi:hypothetical protein